LYEAQGYFQSLYRIVHDLKNQVIAVRNYAMQAISEVGSRYQMYAAIEQLQQNLRNREVALALFFKTAELPGFTGVNLQHTIRDFMAKQMLALPTNIRPEFSVALDAAQVLTSKEFLTSLLENLTQNAIDAMPNGGVLSISANYRSDDSILEITVSDTGVGIPPDSVSDLFTSLKSTKAKGMGLGLATVKRVVEQHDGLIDVVSRLGGGTKFTILLPLQRENEVSHASIGN
jgi:signal transduction histidine kinase